MNSLTNPFFSRPLQTVNGLATNSLNLVMDTIEMITGETKYREAIEELKNIDIDPKSFKFKPYFPDLSKEDYELVSQRDLEFLSPDSSLF